MISIYCLGCRKEFGVGILRTKHLCAFCLDAYEETSLQITPIESRNSLWTGWLWSLSPYDGIFRNLLLHAKLNHNSFAIHLIRQAFQQKVLHRLSSLNQSKALIAEQSLWSLFMGKYNVAEMIRSSLHLEPAHQQPSHRFLLPKRSFHSKQKPRMIHKNMVQWLFPANGVDIIIDDVISSGYTVDRIVCETDLALPKIIVTLCASRHLR